MKKTISLVLVLVLGLATMSPAAEDTWTFKNPIPTGRGFTSGAVVDGKIYIIGGFPTHYSVTAANEMYDPATNQWTVMEPMPEGRCAHASCTFNGKMYVFGGLSPDPYGYANNNVYEYDPQTDTWTQKADMPYTNAFCGIAVLNDTIYIIGGTTNFYQPPISTVMAYDPVTESWTEKAPLSSPRAFMSACVLDGKIYIFGGGDENLLSISYNYVEVYDPATNTWTAKTDIPTSRFGLGTCAMNGKIYAVGGVTDGLVTLTTNEMYDPATDTWTTKSPMQEKRHSFFFSSVGDKIYAIGGSYPDPQLNPIIPTSVEEYDPNPLVVDFNGDEIIDLDDLVILIENWGQDDPMCDIAPPPFGDGIVDVLDLELLMSYWGQEIPDPALMAYWKLDEAEGDIAYDSTGDFDGVLNSNPIWQPEGGKKNGAIELDGVDDYISIPLVLDSPAKAFSVFVWIKGGAPGQVIFSQANRSDWLCADSTNGSLKTDLRFLTKPAVSLLSQAVITDGTWHRVGLVWDESNRILYVDDVEVASDTYDSGFLIGDLQIGAGNKLEAGLFWSGLIDDVRIYNRAITP